ncbi:bactofilin family protein [Clostridium rectalis]|uniref:bactofilin family protein n=1 Tax=Clostridium rectalis TaxID=2040295 RepID=UPI000F64449B|nr:polymer-forming cytoskeletal protein [Clostridium rectalis]
MFNSSNKEKNINKIETLVGNGCTVIGSIKGDDLLKVDGYVEGNILCKDDIFLGNTGYCKGDITCQNAFISGKVEGNIYCSGFLTIETHGKVIGDVNIKNLVIKDGGSFEGNCSILNSTKLTPIESLIE